MNGDAQNRVGTVVMVPVEAHAKSVVGTVVVEDAKETAEDHVLVLAGNLVLEVVLVIVGECLAKERM